LSANESAQAVFICTHNSRRSHLSQLWAKVAASYYGHEAIETFSGGTEATAFNPRAVASMKRAGFRIDVRDDGNPGNDAANPIYAVSGLPLRTQQSCFSKTFDAASNPQRGFIAVMTCSDADEACPFVPGAATRFAIPYADPKAFDGSERESAAYDERCCQIAREMLYALSAARSR
ncbi:MAG: protein-tyrosine-phosphatase, partial [Planctomycetota bacterium]